MTKEKLCLALVCLITGPLFSQYSGYYEYEFNTQNYHVEKPYAYKGDFVDSFALSKQLKRIELSVTTYNNKQSRYYIYKNISTFDANGRLIEHTNVGDTGKKQKINRSDTRNFNEYGKVSSSNHFFYGRNHFKRFEYNDSQQLVKQVNYDRKGIYSIVETSYGMGNLYNTRIYRDKKGRITSMYRYFYYPNKQFKQVVLSDKKGKIRKVWDYTCDETGKSLKKLKDTAKICSLRSYLPDGTVVITTQSFDFHGQPWKTIEHMDSNGRNLKYQYYSGKEERLVYENQRTYNGRKLVSSSRSNYYGRRLYKTDILYDTTGRIISELQTVFRKDSKKKTYKTSYVYNEQGLITERNIFIDGKLKTNEKFRYEFYTKN